MVIDGFSVTPQVGQLISIAADAPLYGAMATPTTTAMLLNRSLETAIAVDDDVVGIGPAGNYSFAFHPHAIALVTRPLVLPRSNNGVDSFVASYNGLSLRVTMQYDMTVQGTRVTVDVLCGVKTLDVNLGCVMFS